MAFVLSTITAIDGFHKGLTFQFQFNPQLVEEEHRSAFVSLRGFSQEHPVIQFVGRDPRLFLITASFHAIDGSEVNSVVDKIARLRILAQFDNRVGRPPLILWRHADGLGVEGFIESVGGLIWAESFVGRPQTVFATRRAAEAGGTGRSLVRSAETVIRLIESVPPIPIGTIPAPTVGVLHRVTDEDQDDTFDAGGEVLDF